MLSLLARRTFASYGLLLMVYVLSPPVAPALHAGPVSERATYGFGELLGRWSPDATPWLLPLSGAEFCYLDNDGVGSYSPGESVFLRATSGCTTTNGAVGAIRLATFAGQPAGARIRSSDNEAGAAGRTFTPDAAKFKYLDADGDGVLSSGDAVYADVLGITGNRVDVGDVRITPYEDAPGGAHVQADDADVGSSVALVGETNSVLAYVDADGTNAFSSEDLLVMRRAADTVPGPAKLGDLRLGGHDPAQYGTWMAFGDADAPARLRQASSAGLCTVGDDDHEPGDVVVFRADGDCDGDATQGDLRLAGPGAGMRITSDDADFDEPLFALGGSFSFRDRGGSSLLDGGDELFLDLVGSATKLDPGDVRLTPSDDHAFGAAVTDEDNDLGAALQSLGTLRDMLGWSDEANNGRYDAADVLYLNRDHAWATNAEDVEVGDVRLEQADDDLLFAGSHVVSGSPEPVTRITYRPFYACVVDSDGGNDHDPDEATYLVPDGCSQGAVVNSIRLVAQGSQAAGTRLTSAQSGQLSALNAQFAYLDADGSSTWSHGDTLYVHYTAGATVRTGDVRLTPYGGLPAGTAVTGSDGDRDQNVVTGLTVSSATAYADLDGSGSYTSGDAVYVSPITTIPQSASYGLVRVSMLEEPAAAPTPPEEEPQPPAEEPTTPTTPDEPTDQEPQAPTDDEDEDDDRGGRGVPGFGLALVVAAVATLAWIRRRRA